jgi:hypothetical protein
MDVGGVSLALIYAFYELVQYLNSPSSLWAPVSQTLAGCTALVVAGQARSADAIVVFDFLLIGVWVLVGVGKALGRREGQIIES